MDTRHEQNKSVLNIGTRERTRDDGEEVVPAAPDAAGMPLNELAQRNGQLLLHCAGRVHVAADAE